MMIDILKRLVGGIAWGGIFTFLALSILMFYNINPDVSTIWLYMLASFVLGMYFGIASFIFEYERWSPLKKTMIHFLLSVTVYFAIGIPVGWILFSPLVILYALFMFIILYILFWFGYRLYYKRIEASLNKTLEEKK